MKLSALEHLVCLECHAPLAVQPGYEMDAEHADEIYAGVLSCSSCGLSYQVARGVPRMIDDKKSSAVDIKTGRSFAESWKRFSFIEERYRKQFYDWVFPVDAEFIKDKLVLECGCGKGRHARLVQEAGAKAVYGVDIGEAIDVAYKNVGYLPDVHLIQADIENLPFERVFDFAFSIGVLHHMQFPIKGFTVMSSKIKGSGSVTAWVYGRENNWWLVRIVNPIRENFTSRLPPSLLLVLSWCLAVPLCLYCKIVARPWMTLKKATPFMIPLYYGEYLAYIGEFEFAEIHHIVFDHLVAPVANYVSRGYFAEWFAEANWPEPVIRWHNRNSWAGFSSHDAKVLDEMRERVIRSASQSIGGTTARATSRSERPADRP